MKIALNHFAITAQQVITGLLKTVYPSVVRPSLRSQGSTLLPKCPVKKWEGGEKLKFGLALGSTDVSSNWNALYTGSISGVNFGATGLNDLNSQMEVAPRYLTSFFRTDMPEILSTQADVGAYQDVIADRMTSLFDSLSKKLATYIYNGQSGFIAGVHASVAAGATSFTVVQGSNADLALQPGTKFTVSSAVYGGTQKDGIFVVQSNNAGTINFAPAITTAWADGDYIISAFNGDSTNGLTGPEGLFDIFPSLYNRTGTAWNTYISQTFRNLTRSAAVDSFAGKFKLTDTTATGFKWLPEFQKMLLLTKNYGALPSNLEVPINPIIYQKINEELQTYGNYNTLNFANAQTDGNVNVIGNKEIGAAFGQMFLNYALMDPYAPIERIYFVPMGEGGLEIWDMGAIDKVIYPQQQLGKLHQEATGSQGIGPEPVKFAGNINKFFNVMPEVAGGTFGPKYLVQGNVFVQPVIRNLDRGGVISLTLGADTVGTAQVW